MNGSFSSLIKQCSYLLNVFIDESNWRNEYPDEESSSNTSGSRDSTEDLTYRHREPYYGKRNLYLFVCLSVYFYVCLLILLNLLFLFR